MADREKIRTLRSTQKILDRGTFEDRCKVHPLQADPSECVSEQKLTEITLWSSNSKDDRGLPAFYALPPCLTTLTSAHHLALPNCNNLQRCKTKTKKVENLKMSIAFIEKIPYVEEQALIQNFQVRRPGIYTSLRACCTLRQYLGLAAAPQGALASAA